MLDITPEATDVVREIRDQRGLPEETGLRVFSDSADDGQQVVRLGFIEEPLAGDQVTGPDEARLFIAPELVDMLSDSVLDVEGNGAEQKLVLHAV